MVCSAHLRICEMVCLIRFQSHHDFIEFLPKGPLICLQASVRALEVQVEAALQKLAESLPQFGDSQGAGGLSTALRDFTSNLEGRMSSSPGICHIEERRCRKC